MFRRNWHATALSSPLSLLRSASLVSQFCCSTFVSALIFQIRVTARHQSKVFLLCSGPRLEQPCRTAGSKRRPIACGPGIQRCTADVCDACAVVLHSVALLRRSCAEASQFLLLQRGAAADVDMDDRHRHGEAREHKLGDRGDAERSRNAGRWRRWQQARRGASCSGCGSCRSSR